MRWEGQSSYICCSLEHGCFGSCSLSVLGVFRVARVDLCGALSPVCLGRGGVWTVFLPCFLFDWQISLFVFWRLRMERLVFVRSLEGQGTLFFVKNLFMQASGLCDGDLIEGFVLGPLRQPARPILAAKGPKLGQIVV